MNVFDEILRSGDDVGGDLGLLEAAFEMISSKVIAASRLSTDVFSQIRDEALTPKVFCRSRLRVILRGKEYFNFEKHDALHKKEVSGRRLPGTLGPGDLTSATASAARHIAECRRDGSKKLPPAYPHARSPRSFLPVRLPL